MVWKGHTHSPLNDWSSRGLRERGSSQSALWGTVTHWLMWVDHLTLRWARRTVNGWRVMETHWRSLEKTWQFNLKSNGEQWRKPRAGSACLRYDGYSERIWHDLLACRTGIISQSVPLHKYECVNPGWTRFVWRGFSVALSFYFSTYSILCF